MAALAPLKPAVGRSITLTESSGMGPSVTSSTACPEASPVAEAVLLQHCDGSAMPTASACTVKRPSLCPAGTVMLAGIEICAEGVLNKDTVTGVAACDVSVTSPPFSC